MSDTLLLLVPVDAEGTEFAEFEVSHADIAALTDSGVVLAADGRHRLSAAGFTIASGMDKVLPALRTVLNKLRTGVLTPAEISIEVALQVGGETGVFFAKGNTEASMRVCLTWRPQMKEATGES